MPRALALASVALALVGCKKEPAPPKPADAQAIPQTTKPPPKPEPPATAGPTGVLRTPWGEKVPATHVHPDRDWVSAFDLGGFYDLAVRGLPAVNDAGQIALASSVTIGDGDASALSVVIIDPNGEREDVVIVDPSTDGDAPSLDTVKKRIARANALLVESSWRPMVELESEGALRAGVEQKLASKDRKATAVFNEPKLVIAAGGKTLEVDGSAWASSDCASAKAVLLSGVWIDIASGAVVARVGYECTTDPIFAVARAK